VQDDFPEMKWFRAGEEIVIDRAKVRPVLKKKVIFELCFLELW